MYIVLDSEIKGRRSTEHTWHAFFDIHAHAHGSEVKQWADTRNGRRTTSKSAITTHTIGVITMDLKLINNDVIKEHAISHVTATKTVTTMPGAMREKVKELRKMDKTEQADAIEKEYTLKFFMDFGRIPLDELVEMAKESQIVPLQNGILRQQKNLKDLCKGDAEFIDAERGIEIKGGKLKVHIRTWLNRSGRGHADPADRAAKQVAKLKSEDQNKVMIAMLANKKDVSFEEAEKMAKDMGLI